jgi:hypothetical protein
MAKLHVEVVGEAGIDRALAGLGEEIRELGKPARAGAELVARTAAGYGPNVDGRLSSSYRALGSKYSGRIVSKLVYAPVIEFGWPSRGIAGQLRVYRALEANTPAIMALFEENIREKLANAQR